MLTPYRRLPTNDLTRPDELTRAARWDDYVLGGLMLVLAGPRCVYAIATSERFGAETTIAAVVACLGALLLVTAHRVRRS